jgi:trimeric autotransporter adhesin
MLFKSPAVLQPVCGVLAVICLTSLLPVSRAGAQSTHVERSAASEADDPDARWGEGFGMGGINTSPQTIALDREGHLLVGGFFSFINGEPHRFVSALRDSVWQMPGGGTSGSVRHILPVDSGFVAAGDFLSVIQPGGDTLSVSRLAFWNGAEWKAMGGSDDRSVLTALPWLDGLVIGGWFTRVVQPDGEMVQTRSVAYWDGKRWHTMGEGPEGMFLAAAVHEGDLYVLTRTETSLIRKLLHRWDGESWSTVGGELRGGSFFGHALASDGIYLYVGGSFNQAIDEQGQTVSTSALVRWDGTSWSAPWGDVSGEVYTILVEDDGSIIVGGNEVRVGELDARHLIRWTGSQWTAVGSPAFDGAVARLARQNGRLYAAGEFSRAGGVVANRLAVMEEGQWSPVGEVFVSGPNRRVMGMFEHGDVLYLAGMFSAIGDRPIRLVAGLDNDGEWISFGEVLSEYSYAYANSVAVIGTTLFASGPLPGEPSGHAVLRHQAGSWSSISMPGIIPPAGVTVFEDRLHVIRGDAAFSFMGGGYAYANGPLVINDEGEITYPYGRLVYQSPASTPPRITALAATGSGLLVGGYFDGAEQPDGQILLSPRVVFWDGEGWMALGDGTGLGEGRISSLAETSDGRIFVAAQPAATDDDPEAFTVRQWDGERWVRLGGGITGSVNAIVAHGTDLYVGGWLSRAIQTDGEELRVHNIARWDGERWHSPGSGVNLSVYALAIRGEDLYVGGAFDHAGGRPSQYLARWHAGPAPSATAAGEIPVPDRILLETYPNPARGEISIRTVTPPGGAGRLLLYDLLGRRVAIVADELLGGGEATTRFNTGALPAGIYYLVLEGATERRVRSVIVVK